MDRDHRHLAGGVVELLHGPTLFLRDEEADPVSEEPRHPGEPFHQVVDVAFAE
ncbi:hypothetical protein [Streptomyces halstedii]|uniref:hypothetical protein n=1 Tax=Streptomyces halstedii TaxID=1944 RepID=UPI0036B8BC58